MVEQVVQRSDNGVSSSKRLFVVPFQDYLEDILLAEIRDKEGKESLLYPSHLLPTIARLVSAFDNSGVENIDTRKLTRIIRNYGALKGIIHFGNKSNTHFICSKK